MSIEIKKEKEIPLLNRKRVTLTYTTTDGKTPARKDMVNPVAQKIGCSADTVAIRHIYTQFGSTSAKIIAHIYKDAETLAKYENKNLLAKQRGEKVNKKSQKK